MSESAALPAFMYADPAVVVEQNERINLGCSICTKAFGTVYGVVCEEEKNVNQRGVPRIGHRCRWFKERS